jgi:methylase of polypeptide subunit release factors
MTGAGTVQQARASRTAQQVHGCDVHSRPLKIAERNVNACVVIDDRDDPANGIAVKKSSFRCGS